MIEGILLSIVAGAVKAWMWIRDQTFRQPGRIEAENDAMKEVLKRVEIARAARRRARADRLR